ncbi:MAG: nuclear transport factor 2 family protein [Anaeromyxobacteraceae bacterium]
MSTLPVLAALALLTAADPPRPKPIQVPVVPPRAADVGSIDGMIRAWYEIVSGPAGQPRDWGRDRTLYIPGVRFVSAVVKDGKPAVSVRDHQAFVEYSEPFLQQGFFEKEIHRVTTRYGTIAHVWSTYESRAKEDGPVTERGINSIELHWDGARWWIAGAQWFTESKEHPIPAEFLPGGK